MCKYLKTNSGRSLPDGLGFYNSGTDLYTLILSTTGFDCFLLT